MIFEGFPGRTQAEVTHPGEGNGIVPGPRGHSKIKDTSLRFAVSFNQIPDWQAADWQFHIGGQEKQIIAEWITENS